MLGAWLPLLIQDNRAQDPLTTFAPNTLALSQSYATHVAEWAKHNVAATYIGATGLPLVEDTAVSAGHKHSDANGLLRWRQVAQWVSGWAPTGLAMTAGAWVRLWLSPAEAESLTPRIKVSTTSTGEAILYVALDYYDSNMRLLAQTTPWAISCATTLTRVWYEAAPLSLRALGGVADSTWSDHTYYLVKVSGYLSQAGGGGARIDELSYGVTATGDI